MNHESKNTIDQVDLSAFREDRVRAAMERLRRERRESLDPERALVEYVATTILDLWDPRSTGAANYQRVQSALDDVAHRLVFMSQSFKAKAEQADQA